MANDKVKIELPVVPTLDRRAARSVTAEIQAMEKAMGPIKVSFDQLAKQASMSVKELNKVSSAAAGMTKNLTQAVKKAQGEIGSLGKAMKGGGGGGGGGAADDLEDAQEGLTDTTEQLIDAMSNLIKGTKSQADSAKRAAAAQADFAKALKTRNKEKVSGIQDMLKSIPNMFKGGKGSLDNILGGAKGIGGGAKKALGMAPGGGQTAAKAAVSGGGGGAAGGAAGGAGGAGGAAAGGMMAAAGAIAIAAAAIVAFAKLLSMASDSQVKINKAMLEGVGFANDLGVSVQGYRDGITEMRDAIQDTSYVMLKFGGTSETTAKIINRFTKESTGSLMQTRNELSQMPGGLQDGVAAMAKAAMGYGKALGMEAEEAAGLMGKFTNELGMSAQGSMDAMQNIVKAAAQSNMPMTKFMQIFNQVVPDIELYQNRMEELIGTVKLLSKTMSAKDIKNFQDAFAKGFKGTDFKQRLKTVLVAGTGTVSKALESDFDAKARSMAKNFKDHGIDEEEFVTAMKGGEDSMAALINKAQAAASKKGQQLQGSSVSDAMKLASFEKTRQKGGALNLATAMSGGGEMATYKILSKFGQTLTTGFDGLSEHVMKQLGITEQQYEALKTTAQGLKVQKNQLKTFGKTNSKSMNAALRETVKLRKAGMSEDEIKAAMADATDDELFAAAARQKEDTKDQEKVFNLAEAQFDVTTSIGDKLDNVIAFLLEQVLRVLNPVLDVLNDMLMWIMGGDKEKQKATQDMAGDIKLSSKVKLKEEIVDKDGKGTGKFKSTGVGETVDIMSAAIQKGLASGKTGKELAKSVGQSGAMDAKSMQAFDDKDMLNLSQRLGGTVDDLGKFKRAFKTAQKTGKTEDMLSALDELPGEMSKKLMVVTQMMAEQGMTSEAGKAKAGGIQTSRPGAEKSMTAQQRTASIQAGQASDIEALGEPIAKAIQANAAKETKAGGVKSDKLALASGKKTNTIEEKSEALDAIAKKLSLKSGADLSSGARKQLGISEEDFKQIQALKANPAAAAGGSPAAAAGAPGAPPPAAAADAHAAVQDTAKTVANQAKTVDEQLKTQVDDYAATSDMLSLLKKGIRYEQSWMGTKYKNVLKDATLESFRTALMEFAVLQVKLEKDDKLKEMLSGQQGANFAGGGFNALQRVLTSAAGKGTESLHEMDANTYATGGSIDYDQMAQVHKGEFVVPKGGMLVKGGEGGGKSVVVNATINVQTGADPKAIQAAVHDLYRQH